MFRRTYFVRYNFSVGLEKREGWALLTHHGFRTPKGASLAEMLGEYVDSRNGTNLHLKSISRV